MNRLPSTIKLAAASLVIVLSACGGEAPKPEALRPVLTEVVGTSAAAETFTYAGEVRSRVEQPLGFRIAGKITERLVDAGAVIKPEQVLARLDPADTALSASAAEAQRQLAAADAHRYRELRRQNFVSQAALDSRETALQAAAAQSDLARNQSAYTVLKADQPGVVGQVLAEVGQVVSPGQAVFRVARADTLEVAIAIPESRLGEARAALAGGSAEITLWADEALRYRGKLREIAAMADPVTRTYAARVSIVDADPRVVFGMTASVRFLAEQAAVRLSIPQPALFQKDGKPAVWLVGADNTVSLRAVEVARYADETVELKSGLERGERIVVAGVHKLSSGEKIRVAELQGATLKTLAK
jgi:multidrug efflux system membrane fusion protein